ncbi:MAG: N-acetyltransferase [Hyphomicrobiales bacterium]|nr:N-acetyltransferase [Hyphomicrobiales bacterium]
MTEDYAVEREDEELAGRYVVHLAEGVEAEMTYRKLDATTIAIDHTFVPREYRGANIALKLVERGIADARAEGIKIVPRCSYVAAQFLRHPEWEDLRAS